MKDTRLTLEEKCAELKQIVRLYKLRQMECELAADALAAGDPEISDRATESAFDTQQKIDQIRRR